MLTILVGLARECGNDQTNDAAHHRDDYNEIPFEHDSLDVIRELVMKIIGNGFTWIYDLFENKVFPYARTYGTQRFKNYP